MVDETFGELSGWGRHPVLRGRQRRSENLEDSTDGAVLSRGLGRSYGDASLPPPGDHAVAVTTPADRLLFFDGQTGVVRAQAGLSLTHLNRQLLPRGWFPPCSPGTESVTLGGMVAADVHGKGHHREGCFGEACDRPQAAGGRWAHSGRVRCGRAGALPGDPGWHGVNGSHLGGGVPDAAGGLVVDSGRVGAFR